ncbi:MAG: carotenoid biosynthesis protein [Armatimonas sp.]
MHSTRQRLLLSALLFAAISGFFVARFPVRPELAVVSAIFVLAFAAPSFLGVCRWLGWKRGILVLTALGLYAMILETVAVKTGVPYGNFSYGPKIGTLLFGAVPWTVPFSWTPLLLWAWWLGRGRIWAAGVFLVLADLCLDPGAVAQGFWHYSVGGAYYQVPISNFLGWILSGTFGAAIASGLVSSPGREVVTVVALPVSGLLSLAFWTSVTFFMGLWIPALVGALLLITSLYILLWPKNA